jgi:SWI/SNF-related matrix-associated actin-dependent regulator 1 of chromatin subfamily A
MGLGKTIQAIAIAAYYFSDWPLLIVCPSQLRESWRVEILKWMPHTEKSDIMIIDTSKFGDLSLVNIISYDLIAKDDVFEKIKAEDFKIVIADESHMIKTTSAKRTKSVCSILEKTKRAILLSGTATPSRPFELFTQIKALTRLKDLNASNYGERYCEVSSFQQFQQQQYASQQYAGAQRLTELNLILSRVMIRRLKSDVLSELPPKKRSIIYLDIPTKDMVSYEEKKGEKICESRLTELYCATAAAKLVRVQQYIKSHLIESKQKCLIFAHHRVMLDAIEETIKETLCDYVRIDGSTPKETRHDLNLHFRTNDDCLFAILGLTVAGTGLNFVPCSCIVFTELSWTPGLILQSEDRCHRIGSTASFVDIRFLVGKGTLDEYMLKLIKKKLSVIGETLDGEGKRAGNGLFDANETSMRYVPGQKTLDSMFVKINNKKSADVESNHKEIPDVIIIDDEDHQKIEQLEKHIKKKLDPVLTQPVTKKRKSDEFANSTQPKKKIKKVNTLAAYFTIKK